MPEIPRHRSLRKVLDGLLESPRTGSCVTHHVTIEAVDARYEEFPDWVEPSLRQALERNGISKLYRHQRLSVDAIRRGEDLCVVTPTASGKTLCYNLPVLQRILEKPETRAFYLFPTKALSQDQVSGLQDVIDALGVPVRTFTYDGDTPADARSAIRQRGHVVVTNPDMLHAGILPNHPRWRKVLADLEYVVIDEMHTYRGVFGSHVAGVLRRLLRLCEFYGSRPKFICCSATIGNPAEHAERLLGRPVTLVDRTENGAPSGPKEVVLYNPPVINAELGIRSGVLSQARRIAAPFVEQGVATICFTGSRLHTEVLARYLREQLSRKPKLAGRIASYRGGYLPGLRRQVERGLRSGDITCVVSTNALELGIDIGRLDVAILAGYPGSVASLWQQAGRAGRSQTRSAVILIARNSPLDQFIINNPEFLFDSSPEQARIDPDNLMVLISHLKCSLYELPFRADETFGGESLVEMLEFLEEAGLAHRRNDTWHWSDESYPADGVSLRSSDPENVVIIDKTQNDRVIAETDRLSAQTIVHEGAIYMVEGHPYQVDRLDWEQCKAYVRRVKVDHYTTAQSYSRVRVLERFEETEREQGGIKAHGEVHVAKKTVGYKKVKLYTSENVGYGDVHLPDVEMHTMSFWLTLPGEPLRAAGYRGIDVVDGLLGLGSAVKSIAALHLMCDGRDLGLALADPEDNWVAGLGRGGQRTVQRTDPGGDERPMDSLELERPTVFIYDNLPGGVGLAEKAYELCDVLLEQARSLIVACSCAGGCPCCVGPIGEVESGARAVAIDLANWLTGRIPRPLGPQWEGVQGPGPQVLTSSPLQPGAAP